MKALQHSGSRVRDQLDNARVTILSRGLRLPAVRTAPVGWIMAWALMTLMSVMADAVSYPLVGGTLTRGGSTDFTVSVPDGDFVDTLEFRLAAEVGSEGFVDYLDVSLISPSGISRPIAGLEPVG